MVPYFVFPFLTFRIGLLTKSEKRKNKLFHLSYKVFIVYSNSRFPFVYRIITSLPVCTQRLLVLLFGTFRVIASNSEKAGTGMTSEALGVSVAPSFFHSCVSDGKTAKMEDVMKFKVIFPHLFYII